jgi:hypothetical protein
VSSVYPTGDMSRLLVDVKNASCQPRHDLGHCRRAAGPAGEKPVASLLYRSSLIIRYMALLTKIVPLAVTTHMSSENIGSSAHQQTYDLANGTARWQYA